MSNNIEIIETVKKIVSPYFKLNMDDFYGDKGSCKYPKIEEISTLFFKLQLSLSETKQQEMVNKIKNLDLGLVEISSVQSLGRYIVIRPYKI